MSWCIGRCGSPPPRSRPAAAAPRCCSAAGNCPRTLSGWRPLAHCRRRNGWRLPLQAIMHTFGLPREHLGRIAINARTNAGLNPDAVYREPMTMDDYLDARMISEPLCLYDCDVPCDGATAVIVSC